VHQYIARTNVDHYLGLLSDHDLASDKRAVITKLLIEEVHKLSRDLEHFEFAETRAANGRDRVNHTRKLRDSIAFGTPEREQAELVLVEMENLQTVLEDCCHRLRDKVSRPQVPPVR
jgi:hypothetical protein